MALFRRSKKLPGKDKPQPKTWYGRLWVNWIRPIGLAVLIVFGFRSMFIDWNDVPSSSMEPTILVGDRIFVNRTAFGLQVPFSTALGGPWWILKWGEPQRGDIVVFFATQKEPGGATATRRLVKRIAGVPGDTLEMRSGVLTVNGQPVETRDGNAGKYARLDLHGVHPDQATFSQEVLGDVLHPVMHTHNSRSPFSTFGPVVVPEGHYLMMGDNRNNSRDSRRVDGLPDENNGFGFVPREKIVGRAFGVAFSVDKVPSFRPRWERFFRGFDQSRVETPAGN